MVDFHYVIAGSFTGFIVGLTGVGGGALMTPILLIFFGISPTTAVATDLWFAAITKIFGVRIHNYSDNIDWKVAKYLWLGSIPISLLIVILINFDFKILKIVILSNLIGFMLIITSIFLFLSPYLISYTKSLRNINPNRFKYFQPYLTVLSGAIWCGCVALTSIGAGALGSLMMLYIYPFRMTPHRIIATDIVHAIPLAIVAGSGYLFTGLVDWWMLKDLLLGSIPSVICGSLIAGKISARRIQIALAFVLIGVGGKVILLD